MKAVPFSPSLPDVMSKPPKRMFAAVNMLLPFSANVSPVGGSDFISYVFVLTAVGLPDKKPVCFVTLETSEIASNRLCAFDQDGSHLSYGTLDGGADLEGSFLKAAFDIIQEQIGPLEQLKEVPQEVRGRPADGSSEATGESRHWSPLGVGAALVALAADVTFMVMAFSQGQIAWAIAGGVTPVGIIVGVSWWWHWLWQYLKMLAQ